MDPEFEAGLWDSVRKYSGAHHDPGHSAAKVNPRLGVGRVSEDIGVNSREIDMESLEEEGNPA